MQVRALDAGLGRASLGGARAHRELGRERDRGVALDVDRDGLGEGGVVVEVLGSRLLADERAADLDQLAGDGHARGVGVAGEGRVDRVDDARAHLREDDRAIVDEHRGLAAAAVDAQGRARAHALDAELPGVVVEAHDPLATGRRDELGEREREVAEDARGMALGDPRGDVRALDEEVEHLARSRAHAGARGRRRFTNRLHLIGPRHGAVRLGFDEDLEAAHFWFCLGGLEPEQRAVVPRHPPTRRMVERPPIRS